MLPSAQPITSDYYNLELQARYSLRSSKSNQDVLIEDPTYCNPDPPHPIPASDAIPSDGRFQQPHFVRFMLLLISKNLINYLVTNSLGMAMKMLLKIYKLLMKRKKSFWIFTIISDVKWRYKGRIEAHRDPNRLPFPCLIW